MMEWLIAFLLGAVFNRGFRGGGLTQYLPWLKGGKIINALAFGIFCVASTHYLAAWEYAETYNDALWYAVAMWLGAMDGWGEYIGAMVRRHILTGTEVEKIDQLILKYKSNPMLWGFLGLTVRGAFWGAAISSSVHAIWPLLVGLLMGSVYYVTITLAGLLFKERGYGWGGGEIVFGGLLWQAALFSLMA